MTRFFWSLVIAAILALPLGIAAGQAGPPKTVTASVTVTTSDSGRVVAVLSKNEPAFLFCIDLPPRTAQKISYTGTARVVYRPLSRGAVPAGIKIEGPENVASVLAVLPSDGKGWLFLAKNETSVLAAADPAAGRIVTVPVSLVRRVDWVGQRRPTTSNGRRAVFRVGRLNGKSRVNSHLEGEKSAAWRFRRSVGRRPVFVLNRRSRCRCWTRLVKRSAT